MDDPILTNEHFHLFGRIIYRYADMERALKFVCAAVANIDMDTFLIMSEPYNSTQLKNIFKSLVKSIHFEDENDRQDVLYLVSEFKKHSKLRNHISHNMWTKGSREGSIRPVHINIRNEKAERKGFDATEPDYTMDDIGKLHDELDGLCDRARQLIRDKGYSQIIERKIDEVSRSKDP